MLDEVSRCPIILLVGWCLDDKKFWLQKEQKFWLQKELENLGFNVTVLSVPNHKKKSVIKWPTIIVSMEYWVDYLKLGWRGARMARHSESVVVASHFIVGFFALLFISMLSKKRQPVIALNMIVRKKGLFIENLRRFVYRIAFLSEKLFITVTSPELRDQYMKTFEIRPEMVSILPDAWLPTYKVLLPSFIDDEFVFSGGEADRDWDTLLSVAAACPEIRFKVIARSMSWAPTRSVTSNVDVLFDTSEEEFYSLAATARLIVLPLVGQVTAGLTVLIRSILLGKMVIPTHTPATERYYPPDCHDLLVPELDAEIIAARLKHYWINSDNRIDKAIKVQNHVLQDFSPEAYANQIRDLIGKIFIGAKRLSQKS